jgi:hypothetical protein
MTGRLNGWVNTDAGLALALNSGSVMTKVRMMGAAGLGAGQGLAKGVLTDAASVIPGGHVADDWIYRQSDREKLLGTIAFQVGLFLCSMGMSGMGAAGEAAAGAEGDAAAMTEQEAAAAMEEKAAVGNSPIAEEPAPIPEEPVSPSESASEAANPPPSSPVGRSGNPMNIEGANQPATINGREYSGHALDRTAGRGIPPSAVENAIQNGVSVPGRNPGTTMFSDPVNGITVLTDTETGRVITVW